MIHVDAFAIQDVATGLFFSARYLGSAGPSRYTAAWVENIHDLGRGATEARVNLLLEGFAAEPDAEAGVWRLRLPFIFAYDYGRETWLSADPGYREMLVRKVRRPCCECCGADPWGHLRMRSIRQVEDGSWRCEKHVGRNPCAIEGCGKTKKNDEPASDDYLCGAHWRLTPRRLKQRDRKIWRTAKRRGWDDRLVALYWRNWRCLVARTRLIVHPPKVEILPSAGPAPAALIAELERIGL